MKPAKNDRLLAKVQKLAALKQFGLLNAKSQSFS